MLSALAIAKNEESNIESFIEQLSFVDEIVIIDSYSTDNTVELALNKGIKIIQREFDDFASQKNFALEQAKNDWVIFLDLDEFLSDSLKEEILEVLNKKTDFDAFRVDRSFNFMGKHLKYSGFQTDRVVRIFDRRKCHYTGLVHEKLEVKGNTMQLKNSLEHKTYKSLDDYNRKLTHYSSLQAKMLYKKNVRPNLYHFMFRPLYRFLHQYFVRLGFLDGKEGFILSYLHGFAVFKRYLFLWALYRNIE